MKAAKSDKGKTIETKQCKPLKNKKKMPEKRELKKVGRKPWVPELDNIERWAMQGMDDKDIAALSMITAEEFCRKKTQLPQLKEALDKGRSKGIQIASGKLLEMILKGDRDATKFFLERKGGWKQTNVIEKKKALKDMTDEELLGLLERTNTDGAQ